MSFLKAKDKKKTHWDSDTYLLFVVVNALHPNKVNCCFDHGHLWKYCDFIVVSLCERRGWNQLVYRHDATALLQPSRDWSWHALSSSQLRHWKGKQCLWNFIWKKPLWIKGQHYDWGNVTMNGEKGGRGEWLEQGNMLYVIILDFVWKHIKDKCTESRQAQK